MGLFDEKKKVGDNLKTLSEKDIQQRLYGHLRQDRRVIQEELPTFSKSRPEVTTQKSVSVPSKDFTPSTFYPQQKPSTPELFKGDELEEELQQETLRSKAVEKKTIPAVSKPVSKAPSFNPDIAAKFLNTTKGFFLKLTATVAGIFLAAVRLVSSIDYKKPAVRKALYFAAGFLVLAFIFTGIHQLNKNREVAMKAPRKITTPKKVKALPPPDASSVTAETAQSATSAAVLSKSAKDTTDKTKKSEMSASEAKKSSQTAATTAAAPAASVAATQTAEISGPGYVIQVATFAALEDAKKLQERFQSEGLKSFTKSVSRSGGRVYYCVFLGKFKTHDEADKQLTSFKTKEVSKPFPDSFVRSMQS